MGKRKTISGVEQERSPGTMCGWSASVSPSARRWRRSIAAEARGAELRAEEAGRAGRGLGGWGPSGRYRETERPPGAGHSTGLDSSGPVGIGDEGGTCLQKGGEARLRGRGHHSLHLPIAAGLGSASGLGFCPG